MATQKRISLAERQRLAAEALEAQQEPAAALPEEAVHKAAATGRKAPLQQVEVSHTADDWGEAVATPEQGAKTRRKSAADYARESGKVALGIYFPDADDLDEARREVPPFPPGKPATTTQARGKTTGASNSGSFKAVTRPKGGPAAI